jgi:hypothetical protein
MGIAAVASVVEVAVWGERIPGVGLFEEVQGGLLS